MDSVFTESVLRSLFRLTVIGLLITNGYMLHRQGNSLQRDIEDHNGEVIGELSAVVQNSCLPD